MNKGNGESCKRKKKKKVSSLAMKFGGNLLVCIWILYLKVISWIFMHRMHSAKKTGVFGWDFGKCKIHFRQNTFYKFSFLEQKSESKIFWILILASIFNFC